MVKSSSGVYGDRPLLAPKAIVIERPLAVRMVRFVARLQRMFDETLCKGSRALFAALHVGRHHEHDHLRNDLATFILLLVCLASGEVSRHVEPYICLSREDESQPLA